jgi:hypothetical protein
MRSQKEPEILLKKQSKEDHEKLIQKFYPNGCILITPENPTFNKDETYELYKEKNDKRIKQIMNQGKIK